jgi:microcin C transport system ATP-binding protein
MSDKSQEASSALFSLRNVSVWFEPLGAKIPIIQELSFNIQHQQIIGITGESGSGKSMTALAIMGLTSFYPNLRIEGEISYKSENLLVQSEKKWLQLRGKVLSLIMQQPLSSFNPVKKIGWHIIESIKIHSPELKGKELQVKMHELLHEVGLSDTDRILSSFPHTLSGGQLQRIVIAMAVAYPSSVIIADELTASLDAQSAAEIMQLLLELRHKHKITILLISHDLDALLKHCDQIILLKNGRKIDHIYRQQITSNSLSQTAKDYFFSSPIGSRRQAKQNESKVSLQVVHINKSYGKSTFFGLKKNTSYPILNDVNLTLRSGEMVGISGISGSGKSTFAKIIAGLIDSDDGDVYYGHDKLDVTKFEKDKLLRQKIQFIQQDALSSMNPAMTIGSQWLEVIQSKDKSATTLQSMTKIKSFLKDFKLDDNVYYKYPSQLSGGQVQRASLMRHLFLQPEIIIMDESLSALDRSTQFELINLMISLQEKWKFAGIFISHDTALIQQLCHRHLIMIEGKLMVE